jgi:hypothetical protein
MIYNNRMITVYCCGKSEELECRKHLDGLVHRCTDMCEVYQENGYFTLRPIKVEDYINARN